MKCFIELWKAKDAWKHLSKNERGDYLSQIGPHMKDLTEKGMEVVNWGANENATTHRANYDFFSVIKFPNQEMADGFQQLVEGAGWYDYFEQVNLCGDATTPDEIIGQLIEL